MKWLLKIAKVVGLKVCIDKNESLEAIINFAKYALDLLQVASLNTIISPKDTTLGIQIKIWLNFSNIISQYYGINCFTGHWT